jgi:UDPglucose--hexose-1-phosphate uridylyltransferase
MSELRQDPTTYDWVIIAEERAKRPHEFKRAKAAKKLPEYDPSCPFCKGNEHFTPETIAVSGNGGDWKIRVVPNKYPALTPDGDTTRTEFKLFRKTHGYGRHEVIIDTPLHNEFMPFMEDAHVEDLIKMYRDRYIALKKDPSIKIIIIFKNHGKEAGTSLEHPHSQIVASPIVPPYIRRKYEVATQYYDNTGRSLQFDIQQAELAEKKRVIATTKHFTVIHPFASHYPFETWLMPKEHKPSFGHINEDEIKDLARVLKDVLLKLYVSLDNPDYNFIINTAPVDDEHKSYYLWHFQIIPKLTQVAGFELGSGIFINTALPEETADFMRHFTAKPPHR